MTKSNNLDVVMPCFGDVRGCKVNHCDVAYYCREATESKERYIEHHKKCHGD